MFHFRKIFGLVILYDYTLSTVLGLHWRKKMIFFFLLKACFFSCEHKGAEQYNL